MPDSFSIAQHYHERTKYYPQMLLNRDLDWSKQPLPFKDYPIGASFDLKAYLTTEPSADDKEQEWQRLSRLLFCTYGLTVKIITMSGDPVYLRASPSAGGLYPVEVYLISRGTPLLPAGLYSYQPQNHALLHFWDSDLWSQLQSACFWHPTLDDTQLAIVTTVVFYRSAWRYQDRAYRRVHLDTGHLLGNLELACAINDYRPHLIGGFMDEAINRLLYLDVEQEAALTVVGLADLLDLRQNLSLLPTALASKTQLDYPEIPDGELLGYLHQASQIPEIPDPPALKTMVAERRDQLAIQRDKYNFPFCLKLSTTAPPIDWGEHLIELEKTIIKRRSTRAYSGDTISLEHLKALLDFTYQPQHYREQALDAIPDYFDLSLVETFIAVSAVEGLDEGCYYYAPKAQE